MSYESYKKLIFGTKKEISPMQWYCIIQRNFCKRL
jgi:hypothetical protein